MLLCVCACACTYLNAPAFNKNKTCRQITLCICFNQCIIITNPLTLPLFFIASRVNTNTSLNLHSMPHFFPFSPLPFPPPPGLKGPLEGTRL